MDGYRQVCCTELDLASANPGELVIIYPSPFLLWQLCTVGTAPKNSWQNMLRDEDDEALHRSCVHQSATTQLQPKLNSDFRVCARKGECLHRQ